MSKYRRQWKIKNWANKIIIAWFPRYTACTRWIVILQTNFEGLIHYARAAWSRLELSSKYSNPSILNEILLFLPLKRSIKLLSNQVLCATFSQIPQHFVFVCKFNDDYFIACLYQIIEQHIRSFWCIRSFMMVLSNSSEHLTVLCMWISPILWICLFAVDFSTSTLHTITNVGSLWTTTTTKSMRETGKYYNNS